LDDLVGEHVVGLEPLVAPDVGLDAHALAEDAAERGVKAIDPPRARATFVVQVRVADEHVPAERHVSST
jgi:hypothetical protein